LSKALGPGKGDAGNAVTHKTGMKDRLRYWSEALPPATIRGPVYIWKKDDPRERQLRKEAHWLFIHSIRRDCSLLIYSRFKGVGAFSPGGEAAGKRADTGYPQLPQLHGSHGARGFVGAITVKNDLSVGGDLMVIFPQLFRGHKKGSGDRLWFGLEFERVADIQNHEVFARIELFLQFFWSDARHAQHAQKSSPLDIFPDDISCQACEEEET
jgi:hypothetical protein